MNSKFGAYILMGIGFIMCAYSVWKPEDVIKVFPTQFKIFGVDTNNPPKGLLNALRILYAIMCVVFIGIIIFFILPS